MLAQEKALGLSPPFFLSRALELPRAGRDILSTVGAPALLLTLSKNFFISKPFGGLRRLPIVGYAVVV